MQIIHLSKNIDREAWLEARRPKVTGKSAKTIKPISRGPNKGQIDSAIGFWSLLAGKIAVQKDGEDPKARGDRLEPVAIQLLADKIGLHANTEPGMWVSDEDNDIAITPDGAEAAEKITWAVEVKALDSALHLKYVIQDRRARLEDGYKAIDSVPNEYSHCYREQCIQYFLVNENLQTLYFVLYDDRIAFEDLMLHFIEIKREDIEGEIAYQKETELLALREVNKLIAELSEG